MKYSFVLPCRNEENAIAYCIERIKNSMESLDINDYEIIVSDSSTDNSPVIARKLGAKVIKHDKEGYGRAYLEGFKAAKGKYIICGDADGSYDFAEITRFVNYLEEGYDFVIGNRFEGKIEKKAMSWSHRYIGNPILSGALRLFFKAKVHDAHCGMRAITKESLEKLNLRTTGMEFASEMIIKAVRNNLRIKEVPIDYYKRKGKSKLRSFADGWRHLRFMLLYSPLFLFFIPGLIFFLIGIISMAWVYFGPPEILGIKIYYHPMFLSALFIIMGYQLIIFALFAKTYAITHLGDKSALDTIYGHLTIEKASIFGILIALAGGIIYLTIFLKWLSTGFGALHEEKNSIVALTLIILGIQTIFSSFMLSILGIKEK